MNVLPMQSAPAQVSVEDRPPLSGYRLAKLEIYNWGTFDHAVHVVQPQGQTTLLVGENGSGKSTLVDALLTLLVRPQTRNYNVAAGATKNERDERTYIRGAFDRTIGEGGRPQIQYLRSGHGHYTALLACFSNQATGEAFSIAQVMYLASDNSVERVYLYSDRVRGIVEGLANLQPTAGLAKQLRERGFQTTGSYRQYAGWLQRKTGFRAKAMDVFNQTVAVKDVQRLDLFIRQHMLEAKPWKDRVEGLLNHFSELSEAHRMLVRVREQAELLKPIIDAGERYEVCRLECEQARNRLDASDYYFAHHTLRLLEPLCEKWQTEMEYLSGEISRLESVQNKLLRVIAQVCLDIEQMGGDRLRQLPELIRQADQMAEVKREARRRFEGQLRAGGLELRITSPEQFHRARKEVVQRRAELIEHRVAERGRERSIQFELGSLARQLAEDRSELEALLKRKNNLPEALMNVRERICHDLRLAASDLPYAAELLSVAPEEQQWEASIEQVLFGFARSLLVPDDLYPKVSGYVERSHLQDRSGRGQRLVYLRVGRVASNEKGTDVAERLSNKLLYRNDHSLTPWVRAEIQARFDYLACDTIEDFQRANGLAMTRNRHLKSGSIKHSKDDRNSPDDRRHFVLGWDNRKKRELLAESIRRTEESVRQLNERAQECANKVDHATAAIAALDQAQLVADYETVDFEKHEFEASQLRLEKQQLEQSDDRIQQLLAQRHKLEAEVAGYRQDRDQCIADRTTRSSELKNGQRILDNAQRTIERVAASDQQERFETQFDALKKELRGELTLDNLGTFPMEAARRLRLACDKQQERLTPLMRELTSTMTRFLKRFPDEQADLDADPASLSSFDSLFKRIIADDLPKHETRFKQRLNEKVLLEIGLLHGGLEDDRQEIRDKIEQLNSALRRLEWKAGTYMRLEPSDVADREIQDFRRELAGCLTGSLEGTAEANEATFVRIEKLVAKLRDDGNDRWRQKVIDVRNWFNFAARELVAANGESRSYYDGGTGQSGGEKGKLAFLVLVAAIAYQYDLDPDGVSQDRFHFVMVDEMFSRSDDQHAEYALKLFEKFGLQLLIVAPLDAKARVTEPYVGFYLHVIKDKQTHRSQLLSITAEELYDRTDASVEG
jgi:uncharacterized protein YPO0396